MIYASRISVGSNDQGEDDSHMLLDTTTSGVYITHSRIDDFEGDGIFKPYWSRTYVEVGKDRTETVNGRLVEGWIAKDEFLI